MHVRGGAILREGALCAGDLAFERKEHYSKDQRQRPGHDIASGPGDRPGRGGVSGARASGSGDDRGESGATKIISNYQFTIFNEFSKGEIFKHWDIGALIGN